MELGKLEEGAVFLQSGTGLSQRCLAARASIKRGDTAHASTMPYASGYDGFSKASLNKRTRIICTLGPACW